jgi:hypothetical protein
LTRGFAIAFVAICVLASLAVAPAAAVSSGTPGPVLFAHYNDALQDDYLYSVVQGSDPVIIPNTAGADDGRWSPDSRVIAFSAYMQGIYLINVDGSGKRLIVPDVPGARAGGPVWSPDGTQIAYTAPINGSAEALVGIFSTVDGQSQVFDAGLDDVFDWTDGYLLGSAWRDYDKYFNKNEEIARWNFTTPGGDPSQGQFEFLTNSYQQDGVPRLSPDGSKIAWLNTNFGWPDPNGSPVGDMEYRLWVMNSDGSDQHQLVDLGTQVTWPAWSPDGTEIVYGPVVSAVNVSSGHVRALSDNVPYAEDGFDWAPLPGTTDDFPVDGVRALAYPDKSAVASASASTGTIKPAASTAALFALTSTPHSVTVTQKLGEPAYATLKIVKPSGVVLKTINYGLKTGTVAYTWNGKLPNGNLAPAGNYKFVAKATDLAKNVKKKVLYVTVVH